MAVLFRQGSFIHLRLFTLVILSFILMVVDHRYHQLDKARSFLSLAVAPLQYAVDLPSQAFSWLSDGISSHHRLVTENTDLRSENLMLRAKMQRMLEVETENKALRALLQSASDLEPEVTQAHILAVSTNPMVTEVVINKGAHHGIVEGEAVLDANGVMGQVVSVGELTSRVMLLTDTRSAIPVQDGRSGVRAVAVGTGAMRELKLIDIPATADVQVGDVLTTSGLGLHFPVGYQVGRVTQVSKIAGQAFSTITITPSSQLDRSRLVILMQPANKAVNEEAKVSIHVAEKAKVGSAEKERHA